MPTITDPDFQKFVEWAFMAIVSGGIGFGARFLAKLSKSIDTLNQNMATVAEKTTWHEKTLERHDDRIGTLERKGESNELARKHRT